MKESFFVGTYTKKTSHGVYKMSLDTETNALSQADLVAEIGNPTYLAKSKHNFLYTVDQKNADGGVAVIDLNTKPATVVQHAVTPGNSPAYVAVDEHRQLLYSSNYHLATVTVYKIADDGTLSQTDVITHSGKGPKPEQADGAHVHFSDLTPDNRLVVCDLGTDEVYTYDVSDAGKLTEVTRYKTKAGFGPRHIVFSKHGSTAYLAGELGSAVEVLTYDQQNGKFSHLQTISTIPSTWDAHNGAAAIKISQDDKFLYVSNRGYNSLAVFAISSDGSLKLIQNISVEGDFPRDFALDPTEKFIVCANQNTDNLTLFSRSKENGKLTLLEKDVALPEGVCVVFE
ncbi:lactonase family protein [Pediococcus inopinatus]|uniref:lactonase family protein n=1 Tax=Pediococcus inopinatus TaxID=114090 RepID=UPI002B25BDE6|nr:lactonase family protein [Pediococcus inopinatus]WPC17855.1 lactonase family protein [Pediococcus inopinatus]